MKKLWSKLGTKPNNLVDEYCFSEGALFDNELVVYDVYGSIAHAKMLSKIGIISHFEYEKLKQKLIEIIYKHKKGVFKIKPIDEDVHTKVENFLISELGNLGKKIHTGRSRNDQVLVDLRLYGKEKIINLSQKINQLIEMFINYAFKYEFIPMPGYTHMQKAMPSSIGMWLSSFAEQLLDLFQVLEAVYKLNNQSPLGSGASYGVSLPIDRKLTAKILSFSKVQNNSLYCQSSRITIQLSIIQMLVQIMLCVSRFASDLLLFTTSEFNFFKVNENICTGSSIMPQKKNLDLMEYVRAKTHSVISYEKLVASLGAGLPSGYNGDFGQTKAPFIQSLTITIKTLEVVLLTLNSIKPNVEILTKACSPEIYATKFAYQYVTKGISFRNAYIKVKNSINNISTPNIINSLKESKHFGGTGNLKLKTIKKDLDNNIKKWGKIDKDYTKVINSLLS